jgi:hypothetical protein
MVRSGHVVFGRMEGVRFGGPAAEAVAAYLAAGRGRAHVCHGSTTSGSARSRRRNSASASPSHRSNVANPCRSPWP